jgi:diguanylate cyclase (GGDEF)-like protein
LTIENSLHFQQVESSATTDYLTGLPNARSLFVHLDREIARAKRHKSPITVLVCDLNGFKQVNDTFGHLEGNRVLSALADVLRDCCREYDYAARMGGDEFVLVLPGLEQPEDIERRVNSISAAVEAATAKLHSGAGLSISVGCAVYPKDGSSAEDLLAEADRSMYSRKQEHYRERRTAVAWAASR